MLASLPSDQLLQRWAWLDRALDEIVGQLPPALRGDFAIPTGRPRVVTCGNTQVGKTTLVLSLLGCRPDAMPDLEVILRAGRTPGQPATAGPLHYVWVDGPDWRVGAGGELTGQVPDEDVASALSAARQRVEQGIALELMTIGLPAKYRAEDRSYAASVTDLPGLQTRSAQEGAAAVRLLGYFAPRADVVIVALRADDLGCLQRGRQLRDLVSAHMLPARRFRLVLTHAAQLAPRTAAPWKRGESGLVDSYREQFATFDYQHDAAMQAVLADQLYLFDLGSNRPTTPSAVPVLAAVDDSTKALLRSLDAAAVSSTRRLTSAESVTIVSRFHERQEQQAKDRLADAEAALAAARKELQEVRDAAMAARGEHERAQATRTQLLAARVPKVQGNRVIARDGGSGKQVQRARTQTGDALVQASERAWQAWGTLGHVAALLSRLRQQLASGLCGSSEQVRREHQASPRRCPRRGERAARHDRPRPPRQAAGRRPDHLPAPGGRARRPRGEGDDSRQPHRCPGAGRRRGQRETRPGRAGGRGGRRPCRAPRRHRAAGGAPHPTCAALPACRQHVGNAATARLDRHARPLRLL